MYLTAATNAGRKPGKNEDAFIVGTAVMSTGEYSVSTKPPFFCGVADGVSGEKSGDVASVLALEVLSGLKLTEKTDLMRAVIDIHKYLRAEGERRKTENMQTTLCVAAVFSDKIKIINVGDSRAYRLQNGRLKQITRDQSLAQLMYEQGQLTQTEKANFSHKNVILPALGNMNADPTPEIIEIPQLQAGEILLFCTDGFYEYVKTADTEQIIAKPQNLTRRVAEMVNRAVMSGSKDNITVCALSL
jgi:protein phosphatase